MGNLFSPPSELLNLVEYYKTASFALPHVFAWVCGVRAQHYTFIIYDIYITYVCAYINYI